MIITIEDSTYSAKPLYYQSLVLLYMPCEKFGAEDTENSLYIKAWQENGYNHAVVKLLAHGKHSEAVDSKKINSQQYADMKNFIGRTFVKCAKEIFGFIPPWGISTGVKPVKLAAMYVREYGEEKAYRILTEEYLISPSKARASILAYINESKVMSGMGADPCSLYISIPFCPTKCNYCSFVSCTTPRLISLIPQYLDKVCNELIIIKDIISQKRLNLKSVYVGGGTPAVLSEDQIFRLITAVNTNFETKGCEFTFEAGRPDCITYEKLSVLKQLGVERVSINTQTTNDEILGAVGRNHTYRQYCEAMENAKKIGFKYVNTDLIAGLPGESYESFTKSLVDVASFEPENITVHAFTLKKSSQYRIDGITEFSDSANALSMTDFASAYLSEKGYMPYYLYRQKNTVGNLDNAGYAKEGCESIYNIIMMGEYHTVFGVGAGSVTKLVSQDMKKVDRIFAPKYPYEFLDNEKYNRFDAETCLSKL